MHIIKRDFQAVTNMEVMAFLKETGMTMESFLETSVTSAKIPAQFGPMYANAIDSYVAFACLQYAKTILFDAEQVIRYIESGVINRALAPGQYHAPFQSTIFQFTKPIPEKLFLSGTFTLGGPVVDDHVLGILFSMPPEGIETINVVALYGSGATQRAMIALDSKGEIDYRIMAGTATRQALEDKQRIVNMAMWCLVYVNSPKVLIEKVSARKEANEKRAKKGKRVLDDYYLIQIEGAKTRYVGEEKNAGGKHSFRYDVIGHPRTLKTGRVIWIPEHGRGLSNEEYRPKVWRAHRPE